MAASATNVQVSNPQVSQQPQQLPTTAGASDISGLLIGLALALVIAGSALRLRFTRH